MAELSLRYAAALFDLAREKGSIDEYLEQVLSLQKLLRQDQCQSFLQHPGIAKADKHRFLRETFAENIDRDLLGFLRLIVDKDRQGQILPTFASFIHMVNLHNKKTTAYVTAAADLNQDQIEALKASLSRKLGKDVTISLKIDPSLIGGVSIHADNYLIDRSIKKRIQDMKEYLKRRRIVNDPQA